MPELADVFRRYGGDYLKRFGDAMLPSHRRALDNIMNCRTEAMGGHVFRCSHCGHQEYAYHSCRNRHCPKCHKNDTEKWLAKRRQELLPVVYFHLVFTLPQILRRIVRRHQKELYGILMKAAAQALIQLAADPRYAGGRIAVLAVLHTWGRVLTHHPHVHCLAPAGALSSDGKYWLAARQSFFVPVKALSRIFRGIFMDRVRKEMPDLHIPHAVWQKEWVVYCKPTLHGAENVLRYLASYVHRVAITNDRILSIHNGKVTFRYTDTRDHRSKTMTLAAGEFIRRFLQHVLPPCFHKVRYYGLWAPANRHCLRRCQIALAATAHPDDLPQPPQPDESPQSDSCCADPSRPLSLAPRTCPICDNNTLVLVGEIPRRGRAPP